MSAFHTKDEIDIAEESGICFACNEAIETCGYECKEMMQQYGCNMCGGSFDPNYGGEVEGEDGWEDPNVCMMCIEDWIRSKDAGVNPLDTGQMRGEDIERGSTAFNRAWALLKNEEWDDDEPLPYDADKYHDQEKNDEIQRILDDIAQRNYEESQEREPTDIEELMEMVEEYEDTGYDGPTDSGPLWENRWNISPPAAGWRMFADSASEYNVEHLLNSGWDPEHIRIIRLGPGEHTPWGYMGGQDTVWVSSASPNFNQTMAQYVKDEPEDYDPWRGME